MTPVTSMYMYRLLQIHISDGGTQKQSVDTRRITRSCGRCRSIPTRPLVRAHPISCRCWQRWHNTGELLNICIDCCGSKNPMMGEGALKDSLSVDDRRMTARLRSDHIVVHFPAYGDNDGILQVHYQICVSTPVAPSIR